MNFSRGQLMTLPFGSHGTQQARVSAINSPFIYVQRYRANSGKWNETEHRYTPEGLTEAIRVANQRLLSRRTP